MSAFACKVDRSNVSGSLVVCTCGFVIGPFMDKRRAVEVAAGHRRMHVEPVKLTPEAKARNAAAQREARASKRRSSATHLGEENG